ncbi:glycosyltransferase family 39 protein [archaeon AH-315-M20]|nr:glycosyltransferase family 39 protein [archaeon AH-315-M20]
MPELGFRKGHKSLKVNKQIKILLILIIVLGTFLRFYNLAGESFWLDEGATVLTIKKYNAWQIINNTWEKGQILPNYYSTDIDLPPYYLILSAWTKIFGISEFSFRLFSAILGSLALIAVFYLARYLFDERIALLSTFLTSINLTLIWYSQEARQYSYLLFLSLLSIIFLIKSLKENKTKYIVGLLIVNTLIIYSHLAWIIFIALEGVYALYISYKNHINKKEPHKKIVIVFLIIGLLYLPIIERVIFSESKYVDVYGKPDMMQLAEFGVLLSTWLYPSISMREKIYSFSMGFTLFEWILLLSVLMTALLFGLLFLNGIVKSFYKKKSAIFMLLLFFFPLLFALIVSLIHPTITIFQLKQIIYIIPAFLIFVSIGILRTKISKLLISGVIILSILPLSAYYINIDKQQFREAVEFLPENEPIFLNIVSAQVAFQYYSGERDNVIGVADVDELKSFLYNKNSFWMLLTFTKYSDPENKIKKFLNENYQLTDKKDLFDIELLHYEKI